MTTQTMIPAPAHPQGTTIPPGEDPRSAGATLSPAKIRLGEELPIFCEKCGYALHGLPQNRCAACDILQFHCPECGHHQPINTLRPAFQKLLGRIRAFFVAVSVFFKINFFGWLLVAWFAMGVEFSYTYDYSGMRMNRAAAAGGTPGWNVQARVYNGPANKVPQRLDWEEMLGFSMFGLFFGMFSRMLLLRWRRGYAVGAVLAALVAIAIALGALAESTGDNVATHPFTPAFLLCMATAAVTITLGASIVWGVWTTLVAVFLPKRTGAALLDWQRSLSNRPVSALARE
jgi:hypothetical protein